MTRTQQRKPNPHVGRDSSPDAARKAAGQTLVDCHHALAALELIDAEHELPEDEQCRMVQVSSIESRCLALIESALAVIERDAGLAPPTSIPELDAPTVADLDPSSLEDGDLLPAAEEAHP